MYMQQYAYTIVPGQERRAVALCERLARVLRERGLRTRVLVGGAPQVTVQLVEEYTGVSEMGMARASLRRDAAYRDLVVAWAAEFYPLVSAYAPAMLLNDQPGVWAAGLESAALVG